MKDDIREFVVFVIKFLLFFSLLYYGTYFYIGLVTPGGMYLPFLDQYFNYIRWLRLSLLQGSGWFLSLLNINTFFDARGYLGIVHGRMVFVSFSCLGYGIISFWLAYVLAIKASMKSKWVRILIGVFLLWFINVSRISLFLLAINKNWPMPLGIDHHTWFNIFSYLAIFLMIILFERAERKNKDKEKINEIESVE